MCANARADGERKERRGRTLDVNGTHSAQEAMSHIQWILQILLAPQHHPRRSLTSIIKQSHLVDHVQLTSLSGDVGSGEHETLVQIRSLPPFHELRYDLTIVRFVKLIDEHTVESAQVLYNTDRDLEESFEVWCLAQLVIDLSQNREYVHRAGAVGGLGRST